MKSYTWTVVTEEIEDDVLDHVGEMFGLDLNLNAIKTEKDVTAQADTATKLREIAEDVNALKKLLTLIHPDLTEDEVEMLIYATETL